MIAEVTHGLPTSLPSNKKTRNRALLFICSVRVLRQQPPSSTGTIDKFAGLVCGNRGLPATVQQAGANPILAQRGYSWRDRQLLETSGYGDLSVVVIMQHISSTFG